MAAWMCSAPCVEWPFHALNSSSLLSLNRWIGCACMVASQALSLSGNVGSDRGHLCAENQEQAQAATMRENVELKAKVASLENALNGATCDLPADLHSRQSTHSAYASKPHWAESACHAAESDIRVWRAMLHAAEMHSKSDVTVAENLRSLIASASAQVEANQYQQQLEAQANLNGEAGTSFVSSI